MIFSAREWEWKGLGTDYWMHSLMLQKESINCSLWRHSALFHLRSGERVASGWDYPQSHLCWKAFLFGPLVFHQIKELNNLNRPLQYYWSWFLQRKTPNSVSEEKNISFQLSLQALCMAHYSTAEMPMPHKKERLQQPQLRLALLLSSPTIHAHFQIRFSPVKNYCNFFSVYSLQSRFKWPNSADKIQESTTGQLLHLHYACRSGVF